MACAGLGGCAEPVVDLSLIAPASAQREDLSCVTAVEVRTIGSSYDQDRSDYKRACLELPHSVHTYAELRDMIHGRVALDVPDSGLEGVTVRGWAGVSACERTDETDEAYKNDFTSNLVFYAKSGFAGDDELGLPVVPNLKCQTQNVKVRVVDMLALVASGSSTACATAMMYTDRKGWSGIGTIVPKLFARGVDFFGNASWAAGMNSLVQFDGMVLAAEPGKQSCIALAGANDTGANTACLVGVGAQSVCATSGELETAAIDYSVWNQVDRTLQGRFPSVVWSSVWTNVTPKRPIAGATVAVDPEHGKVVYIDPPDAGGVVHARQDQTGTGPSGLFVLYADAVVSAKISAGARTRTLLLGAPDYTQGGAMIVMP